ncbi:hypothetical protein [Acetobacterium wieringae]|nr:hypothetical protein [Acetobacterium wieringae]
MSPELKRKAVKAVALVWLLRYNTDKGAFYNTIMADIKEGGVTQWEDF